MHIPLVHCANTPTSNTTIPRSHQQKHSSVSKNMPNVQNMYILVKHSAMFISSGFTHTTRLLCIHPVCIRQGRSNQPSATSTSNISHPAASPIHPLRAYKLMEKSLLTVGISMTGIKSAWRVARGTCVGHTAATTLPSSLHMHMCAS